MKKFIYGALIFAPGLVFAQNNLAGVSSLVSDIGKIIGKIVPILFALAVVFFFWGVVKYLMSVGSDIKKADEGKTLMIYGIIAIAVMASLYGLVGWLQNTLNIGNPAVITIPNVPTP